MPNNGWDGFVPETNGEEFEKPSEGVHSAVIVGVYDSGWADYQGDKNFKKKEILIFALDQKNSKGETFFVHMPIKKVFWEKEKKQSDYLSLVKAVKLQKHIRAVTVTDRDGNNRQGYSFDTSLLLGKMVQVMVSIDSKGYVNITNIMEQNPNYTPRIDYVEIPKWTLELVDKLSKHPKLVSIMPKLPPILLSQQEYLSMMGAKTHGEQMSQGGFDVPGDSYTPKPEPSRPQNNGFSESNTFDPTPIGDDDLPPF